MKRKHGRKHAHLSPEGRLAPDAYTAAELHQFLVTDAVRSHSTTLPWAVAAYARIGKLERCGPEAAFQRVRGEVEALTGRPMPVQPNAFEAAALKQVR